jgi:hypothetical protein
MKLAILPVSKHCRNKLDICRHCMQKEMARRAGDDKEKGSSYM